MPKSNKRLVRQRSIRTIGPEKYDGIQSNELLSQTNPVATREEAGYSEKWKTFYFKVKLVNDKLEYVILNMNEKDYLGTPVFNQTGKNSFYLVFPKQFEEHKLFIHDKIFYDSVGNQLLIITSSLRSYNYVIEFNCIKTDSNSNDIPTEWAFIKINYRVTTASEFTIQRIFVESASKATIVFTEPINLSCFTGKEVEDFFVVTGTIAGDNIPTGIHSVSDDKKTIVFNLDVPFSSEETIEFTYDGYAQMISEDLNLLEVIDGLSVENLL